MFSRVPGKILEIIYLDEYPFDIAKNTSAINIATKIPPSINIVILKLFPIIDYFSLGMPNPPPFL